MTTDRTSAPIHATAPIDSAAKPSRTSSKLDRAIAISLAAMTLFVLAQQLQPAPVLADARGVVAAASA